MQAEGTAHAKASRGKCLSMRAEDVGPPYHNHHFITQRCLLLEFSVPLRLSLVA